MNARYYATIAMEHGSPYALTTTCGIHFIRTTTLPLARPCAR
jgi:hypothetical protein